MVYERIVKRFYDELENGKIMGRKCTQCGAVEFPPVLACNECSCPDMEWIEMKGTGEVQQLIKNSMMTMTPENEFLAPYCFGNMLLEEGVLVNGIITGVEDVDELKPQLPLPVKMKIIQRDGYKAIAYEIVK